MIQDYIWKIFPPYEVKVTREYIKEYFKRYEAQVGLGSGNTIKHVRNLALERIKNHRAVVNSVRIENIHPENIALIQIVNSIDSHLGSGACHIYRNTLSDDGRCLMRLLNSANKILVEKKYMSQAEVNKFDAELKQQISRAG